VAFWFYITIPLIECRNRSACPALQALARSTGAAISRGQETATTDFGAFGTVIFPPPEASA
jgi:hypothetical protein